MQNPNISQEIIADGPFSTLESPTDMADKSHATKKVFYKTTGDTEYLTAKCILGYLFEKRRLLPFEQAGIDDYAEESKPHIEKILHAIRRRQAVHMILPAFPAKSPNRQKTLGPLPDLAEKHALYNLQQLCDRIKTVYLPGAKITICSDGRVFADLVRIPDQDVTGYNRCLREYANSRHKESFGFFNLEDAFGKIENYDILREELLILHGESINSLRRRCKEEKEARSMYCGITRFIFEDYCGIEPFMHQSRTSIQKIARLISYRVIQRSNAWSRLLEKEFPNAIRLSIHPQYKVSKKIGVFLGNTGNDSWLTPWHAAAVKENGEIVFRKRIEAEKNAMLAYDNGRPSHFEIPAGSGSIMPDPTERSAV
jgi:pyoverdine/dityrosine biosynthesis protein Dit1